MTFTARHPNVAPGALALSYVDQMELTYGIINAAAQLEQSPFVTPRFHEIDMKGIPLTTSKQSAMSLNIQERQNGVNSARIAINDPHSDQSRTYQTVPSMEDYWSIHHPTNLDAIEYVRHGDVVDFLSIHLGKIAALDHLLDKASVDSVSVARTIQRNLPRRPRSSTVRTDYSIENGAQRAELVTRTSNAFSHFALIASGIYEIGNATATKTYWYDVTTRKSKTGPSKVTQAKANVFIASDNGLSVAQLEDFVLRDQERNSSQDILRDTIDRFVATACTDAA